MADDNASGEAAEQPAASRGGVLPWIIVGVVSAGLGSAAPLLLPSDLLSSQAAGAPEPHYENPPQEDTVFIPFGERGTDQSVIVNLNDGRMTRYLKIAIALQVAKADEVEIKDLLESKQIILRNWLLSMMSDKALDEIRGAAGQNRMRREIRDHFNDVLFPDGVDRIYDVLFEEFNVQ